MATEERFNTRITEEDRALLDKAMKQAGMMDGEGGKIINADRLFLRKAATMIIESNNPEMSSIMDSIKTHMTKMMEDISSVYHMAAAADDRAEMAYKEQIAALEAKIIEQDIKLSDLDKTKYRNAELELQFKDYESIKAELEQAKDAMKKKDTKIAEMLQKIDSLQESKMIEKHNAEIAELNADHSKQIMEYEKKLAARDVQIVKIEDLKAENESLKQHNMDLTNQMIRLVATVKSDNN